MKIGKSKNAAADIASLRRHGQFAEIWGRLCQNKLALVGMGIVFILVFVAVFAEVLAPYPYDLQDYGSKMLLPCREHPLGTDDYGRDLLSRIMYGGRISLLVAIMAVAMSLVVGGFLGAVSGYFGGTVDTVMMRIMDILQGIPEILMAVCVSALLGGGVWQTAIAIAVSGIAPPCRMLRANVLTIRSQEYVEAARVAGASNLRIIVTHCIPNSIAPIIVDATLRLGGSIMTISSLAFLGLGVQPPTPEWGAILNSGREYIRTFWPMITFPGIAIVLTMFGFNVFGDGLRDALDPKLKK